MLSGLESDKGRPRADDRTMRLSDREGVRRR